MAALLLSPDVLLAPADDGYLAYHPCTNRLYRLNPTAALLVELCDGTREQEELLTLVEPWLPAEARRACINWLRDSLEQGLLVDARNNPRTSNDTPHSAERLQALAQQLRRQDRVLAAYICQRAATQRAAADPSVDAADQWYALAELAHIVGRRHEARAAYERYFESHPEDVEVAHLLTALCDALPPSRASDQYIEQLYSQFASYYDDNMLGDLNYQAPDLLSAALMQAMGDATRPHVLELGCGTGLFGQRARPWASRLTGVDLSAAMVQRAQTLGIYERLETAEITAWLDQEPIEAGYDVIALCDTLIYFGDLRQVLPRAARRLRPGGILGFTVERCETRPFALTDSGRFAHHQDHLLQVAMASDLHTVSQACGVLRHEYGEPVQGWITVLRKPAETRT